MKISVALHRRLHWLNFPGAVLLALLQRMPVLRVAASAEDFVLASPAGAVLRSAVGVLATLGALHSLAGATTLSVSGGHTSPLSATVGTAIPTVLFTTTGTESDPESWKISGTIPPGLSFSGRTTPGTVNVPFLQFLQLSGTPTTSGSFSVTLQAFEGSNLSLIGSPAYTYVINVAAAAAVAPTISGQPASVATTAGNATAVTVFFAGSPAPTIQWQHNGSDVSGGTSATLALPSLQPADAGLYIAQITNSAGSTTSDAAIVGVTTTSKVIGTGSEIAQNISAPNGNIYDQVLLSGAAATITADSSLNQISRTSFIDLTDDIVQVEFGGAGTLTMVLDNPSGPAAPVNYNQPTVAYMKGHVGIVITGADETTNVSFFSVGRLTAFDPTGTFDSTKPISSTNNPANNKSSLFAGHDATVYNGLADLAFIAISTTDGKFGGVRTSNATFYATKGLTGVYAPGVQFTGPVFIGDISASDSATPVIMIGSSSDTRITGGDLLQANGKAVQVSGLTALKFTAGADSNNNPQAAKNNLGVLMQSGADVTAQVAVNPSP